MITLFRMSDALKCILVNAPGSSNLAAPTEVIVRCRPLRNSRFWAQSLNNSSNRVTVGDWDRIKLMCLASARTRSGIRSWEIDRLLLADSDQALELLEQVSYSVGCNGAEKVFLRVPSDSDLVDIAKRVGFFPYFNEVHLAGSLAPLNIKVDEFSSEQPTPADLQGLFQLYCAATPQEVRQGIGMTIDQWRDSLEPAQTHLTESVLKHDGKIIGWRRCNHFGQVTAGQILGHPGHPDSTQYLVDISYQTRNWLVPNYQIIVSELLEQQGLHEVRHYTMLVKTISVPARSREFSYVEA